MAFDFTRTREQIASEEKYPVIVCRTSENNGVLFGEVLRSSIASPTEVYLELLTAAMHVNKSVTLDLKVITAALEAGQNVINIIHIGENLSIQLLPIGFLQLPVQELQRGALN